MKLSYDEIDGTVSAHIIDVSKDDIKKALDFMTISRREYTKSLLSSGSHVLNISGLLEVALALSEYKVYEAVTCH